MLDLIVSVSDHCLSFYSVAMYCTRTLFSNIGILILLRLISTTAYSIVIRKTVINRKGIINMVRECSDL